MNLFKSANNIAKNLADGLLLFNLDGRILNANPAACELFGWPLEELKELHVKNILPTLIPQEDGENFNSDDTQPLTAMSIALLKPVKFVGRHRSGQEVELVLSLSSTPEDPNNVNNSTEVLCLCRTPAQDANQGELLETLARYALAVEGSRDGLWHWDLKKNEVYYSPRWKAMLGYRDEEISTAPKEWLGRMTMEDRKVTKELISSHLKGNTHFFENEYRIMHKDGTYRWMLARGLACRDREGHLHRLAGFQTDMTAFKEDERQRKHDSLHDSLTELPNRMLFIDRVEQALARSKANKTMLAVLVLGLDRFKNINNSFGRRVGDQLLVEVAHRLRPLLPSTYTAARLGGDEFAILMDEIQDSRVPQRMVSRIHTELGKVFHIAEQDFFIKTSIGVALSTRHYEQAADMLRDADAAKNRAKSQGQGSYELFATNIRLEALTTIQLEADLRRAFERKEFRVFYQPMICLRTGDLLGFESLVRWVKEGRSTISPAHFIPIAEDTGLIVPLGMWILEESCRQMVEWQKEFNLPEPLKISVNLSNKQFVQPDLKQEIERVLHETGLPGRCLKLEITESVIMDDVESVTKVLNDLKKLEIQFSIDDFGTGYSSLSYLHLLPLDTLKIDRSFVSKMNRDEKQAAIVRTVISLAKNLNMSVVAEGVEYPEHVAALQGLSCDIGQGYYFAKPLKQADARELIHITPHWASIFRS